VSAPIEGRARELIDAPNFCHLATIGADGTPHLTITWVDVEDGLIVVNSAEGRAWPRNLRRDPRVTLTVTNAEDQYEYVEVRGRVVADEPDPDLEVIDRLSHKYRGEDYPRHPEQQRVTFRIEPQRVRHYG
jgi:PPOX class probable F420-dependent enzyme